MGLFKTKRDKEIEKKILIKRTLAKIQQQLNALEQQRKNYLQSAREAISAGLKPQLRLAASGLKMTLAQERRAKEMLLNFKIVSQMREMTAMTSEFLKGMSVLSKEMTRMTNLAEFDKVQQEFEAAMLSAQMQTEKLDQFLDATENGVMSATTQNTDALADDELVAFVHKMIKEEDRGLDTTTIDQLLKDLNENVQ